jgi:hypothetical protein
MRLVRHEQRRHADAHLVPNTKEGRAHHAQRLQSILDAQSDVLDTLNAMTKVHVDKTKECMEIIYDLYTDALLFSHRGKNLAPASHPKYHCYYMIFKDLEELIHRQYSKSQREHTKIRTLCCPYCDVPLDYFKSPPPPYDPPSNPPAPLRSDSPSSPRYSPTQGSPLSLTTVFPTHHPKSFPALTLHFWAKTTLMTLTFNIWKYEKS